MGMKDSLGYKMLLKINTAGNVGAGGITSQGFD